MNLVEEEGKAEGNDVGELMLNLWVDLFRLLLIQSFAEKHDIPHEVFKLVEPLLNDFFRLAFDKGRAKHVHDRVNQALLFLRLQLLCLILLLIHDRLA